MVLVLDFNNELVASQSLSELAFGAHSGISASNLGLFFFFNSSVFFPLYHDPDITLPTKVRLVKAMVFPVVMYGCESWTINKAEH